MASIPVEQAREDVAALFLSYLNRAPEFEAMNYYLGLYNQLLADQGDNPAATSNAFKALSAQIYVDGGTTGEVPVGPAVGNAEYVTWIYTNVLGREPDPDGLAYWEAQLASGGIDRAELVGVLLVAAEADPRDGAYVANRTQVAVEFAKFENSNPNLLPNLAFNAKQVLEGVNEDPATIAAAEAKLYSATNGGESFTLTVGVDDFVGSSGDDVFNAVPVNATDSVPATTLNQFDTVDGGLGRDTFNIYTDGTNNIVQQGTIRNVEVINIYNTPVDGAVFGDAGIDASTFQGAEEVWQYNRATTVNNLGATTAAGFGNVTVADSLLVNAAAAAATVAFANVSGDESGAVDLTVAGKSLTQVTLAGELTAAAEGADDPYVSLTANNTGTTDVGTFVLSSAVNVRVAEITGQGLTAIDASGSTGDIWYEMADSVNSFTGGSGDDVVVFARPLQLTDSVDGGEGTDTVFLSDDGKFVTQTYDALAGLTNIENLGFIGAGVSVDAAELTGFTSLAFAGTGAVTIQNLAADQAIDVMVYDEGEEDTSPDSVTLSNAAADVTVNVDAAAFDLLVDGASVGATGGTLTLTGASGIVDFDNNEGAKFATIDVSAFSGILYYTLADDLAETVTLGAGSTTVYVGELASSIGALDTIENFKPAGGEGEQDFLDLPGTLQDFTLTSAATTLNLAWAEAAAAFESDTLVFSFQGDTYLYADTEGETAGRYDDADFALKLAGEFVASQLQPEQPVDLVLI